MFDFVEVFSYPSPILRKLEVEPRIPVLGKCSTTVPSAWATLNPIFLFDYNVLLKILPEKVN